MKLYTLTDNRLTTAPTFVIVDNHRRHDFRHGSKPMIFPN